MTLGGLSAARLRRLHEVLARYVEGGGTPGLVAVVERQGQLHVDAIGCERDAIFRIASMTKPVAAAAAMILVEEGRLRLDDPVTELLPELSEMRVLRRIESPIDDTVPANRAITLRDLLTFRLGTGFLSAEPDSYPIQRVLTSGPESADTSPGDWLRKLAAVPLVHQPGEVWMYHTGSEVLGILVARAARQSLGEFLGERIFEPLGMVDTGFFVQSGKLSRLMLPQGGDAKDWCKPPAFESAGGGLASTADDYLQFSHMMLNRGTLNGRRVLSRPAIEAMTMDHLTATQKIYPPFRPDYWETHGWGFGLTVVTRRFDIASTPGKFGWDGGSGTSWRADPAEQMTTILLTATPWASAQPPRIYNDFWTLAYSAIAD